MSYADVKAYRQRRLLKAREYLGGVCVVCRTCEQLEFDHIDASSKEIEIANAIANGWSWKRLVTELEKCQLLCVTHHIEKSKREGDLKKEAWNKGDHHGSHHGAYVVKCPCDPCKQYKIDRNTARRRALR